MPRHIRGVFSFTYLLNYTSFLRNSLSTIPYSLGILLSKVISAPVVGWVRVKDDACRLTVLWLVVPLHQFAYSLFF